MSNEPGMLHVDVLVVGAGPAGLSAGIEAAALGACVLLLDDKHEPGGQLVKQTHMFFGSKHEWAGVRGIDIAVELAAALRAAGAEIMTDTMAIGIFDDGVVTAVRNENKLLRIVPRKLIVATGALPLWSRRKPILAATECMRRRFVGWACPSIWPTRSRPCMARTT